MSQLETDLSNLSEAILEENLNQVDNFEDTVKALEQGLGPFSLTLQSSGQERQSLVLHALQNDDVLVFDPTHQLSQETEKTGMTLVPRETLRLWFTDNQARALIPEA